MLQNGFISAIYQSTVDTLIKKIPEYHWQQQQILDERKRLHHSMHVFELQTQDSLFRPQLTQAN